MTTERARRYGALGVVAALTAAALALRVVALGRQPFWIDEAFSLLLITYQPVHEWRFDVHPPLYYAMLWLWSRVSTTDAWLRLLSALLGAATVPVVYAVGQRLLGRAGGLWAAAFFAVTWFHVFHSREARMYSFLALSFALALWGIVAGARDGQRRGWVIYALAGAMVAWSQAVGVYYAAMLAGLALVVPRDGAGWGAGPIGSPRGWAISTAALAALCAPWAPVFIARGQDTAASFWVARPNPEPPVLSTIHNFTIAPIPAPAALLRAYLGMDLGASFGGAWLWMVPLLAALALALALGEPRRRRVAWFLALAYVLPIALFTAASLVVRPILIPRILLPATVPMVLLLAAGVTVVPRRWGRALAGLAVGGLLLLGAAYGLRYERSYRDEAWREASRHVQAEARAGDVLFDARGTLDAIPRFRHTAHMPSTAELLFLRYDETGRLRSLPWVSIHRVAAGCRGAIGACLDAAFGSAAPHARIWYIRRLTFVPEGVQAWIDSRLEQERVLSFGRVFVEERRLRPPGAR